MESRPLNLNDASEVSAVADLINSAYRGESSKQGWTTEADFLEGQRVDSESLREEVRGEGKKADLLVSFEEGKPLGCVFVERVTRKGKKGIYIGMVTVSPKRQNQGMGRRLVEIAEAYGRNHDATFSILGVIHLRESLIQWYERRGYVRNGETHPFPYGDDRLGRPLRDDLHFVMLEKPL